MSGEPVEGSEREKEFYRNKQHMVDMVSRIIRARRVEGGSDSLEEIPFIDSLLQNYSSEEKVTYYNGVHIQYIAVIELYHRYVVIPWL